MTDDERFFDGVEQTTVPGMPAPVLAEWDGLPLTVRVADKLVEALIIASEVRADLEQQEAAPLRWIEPEIERVLEQIDKLLQRLAS